MGSQVCWNRTAHWVGKMINQVVNFWQWVNFLSSGVSLSSVGSTRACLSVWGIAVVGGSSSHNWASRYFELSAVELSNTHHFLLWVLTVFLQLGKVELKAVFSNIVLAFVQKKSESGTVFKRRLTSKFFVCFALFLFSIYLSWKLVDVQAVTSVGISTSLLNQAVSRYLYKIKINACTIPFGQRLMIWLDMKSLSSNLESLQL